MVADNRIWFGVDGDARPAVKRFISEVTDTIPATTWWEYSEVGHNDEAKKESKVLFGDALFGTPKPERLMERIVLLGSSGTLQVTTVKTRQGAGKHGLG
jgi:adenine-specific DNA-methyltransferase